jgi:phage tail-like protein
MTADDSALGIAHVASIGHCYPGETVTLFTRVDARAPLPGGLTVQIGLPESLTVGSAHASAAHGEGLPDLLFVAGARYLRWTVARPVAAGERFEYTAEAQVAPTERDLTLESDALAASRGERPARAQETLTIQVEAQGRYVRHLPALYQTDELMGRFLMLFESFWGPIDRQINDLHYYFDPKLTPPEALGWLSAWVDLELDQRLSVPQQRQLLGMAAAHYRRRGSRQGLVELLQIYTGVTPTIIEHTARNFRLGPDARMGPNIALGSSNQPHAFTVVLRLPPAGGPDPDRARREQERQIAAIIEAEKPAHTVYTLRVEPAA